MNNNEFLIRWLSNLWSGKYEKATGALTNKAQNKFCTKGVAADQLVKQDKARWGASEDHSSMICVDEKKFCSPYKLPRFAAEKLYLHKKVSVSAIADILEKRGYSSAHFDYRAERIELSRAIIGINDEVETEFAESGIPLSEIGDILYEIYKSELGVFGVKLPSKSSIKEVTNGGGDDDDDEEEEENDKSPEREPIPA